ncbi:gas vesicle protein GvpA [Halomarina rubra]|uniref:Gas vesicle protein A n=1 Tax=Halomarina rubra TaxID=2071873 RepID=A0ABD6AUC7_9EURY|nr:gas vesicle structural protein GvpA [Halomarina rubra]
MTQRAPESSSLADALDRILDKGIVIDVWARISIIGLELITIEARIVVASVDTFIHYAEEITTLEQASAEGELDTGGKIAIDEREETETRPKGTRTQPAT